MVTCVYWKGIRWKMCPDLYAEPNVDHHHHCRPPPPPTKQPGTKGADSVRQRMKDNKHQMLLKSR